MILEKYSLGTGDRFGQEGNAQLKAIQKAKKEYGVLITPVWNKSHREHEIIGTGPQQVRQEADEAVKALDWDESYLVDADHITKDIVDSYIDCSNFFTIDVADYIGESSEPDAKKGFIEKNRDYIGELSIPGISEEFTVSETFLADWADQYLEAIKQACVIFKYIREQKKTNNAVFEISMDEVESPQTPIELFFILKTAAEQGISIHTIAPKFTGDFHKGVDYAGNINQFVKEFEQDILVITHAVKTFALPKNLKLSVHSGSDKFSLYPHIHKLMNKHDAGIHLKTSGTTWLEELIGLAKSGSEGLDMVQAIYKEAYHRYDELTQPYKPVIDIEEDNLPDPQEFLQLKGSQIASKLEHNPGHSDFDPQLRQFMHCAYKIAAEQGDEFIRLLQDNNSYIGNRVTENLFSRHIKPLFLGK